MTRLPTEDPTEDPSGAPAQGAAFTTHLRVRSYELDSLGHVNHAVYLNYLEVARFDALEAGGFPLAEMKKRGWAVHIVRVEADYRAECRLGDELEIRTWVERFRNSSMILRQELLRRDEPALTARLVAVWVGPDGRPMRIPDEVRGALQAPPR